MDKDRLHNFILDNQMKVLLINDNSSSKISVTLDINIGNYYHIIFLRIFV